MPEQIVTGEVQYAHDGEKTLVNNGYRVLDAQTRFDENLEAVRKSFIDKDTTIARQRLTIYWLFAYQALLTVLFVLYTIYGV